jgi:hypothetical protein
MLITDVELTSPDPGRAAHRYADLLEVTPRSSPTGLSWWSGRVGF